MAVTERKSPGNALQLDVARLAGDMGSAGSFAKLQRLDL